MRIAFVYDTSYPDTKGGVERRVWELARQLVSDGHRVELLVPKLWDGPRIIERDGVVVRGVCRGGALYRKSGRRAVLPSLRHALGVYRALRRSEFDVVDCQVPAHLSCLSTRLALRSSGAKQTITWHEAWGRHWLEEFGVLGYVGQAVESRVARLPVTHIGVSDDLATAMRSLGIEPKAVIEAGVDVAGIEPILPDRQVDVAFVGRLVPTKNLGLLLQALRVLRDSGRKVTLRVVGDGPLRDTWEQQAHDLDLDGQVEFLGSVPEWESVVAVMKGARVLAMPSIREGFGLVALEAMACGIPVVTVDHPRNAAARIVDHDVTGLVVPASAADLADAISLLVDDPSLCERLSKAGLRTASAATWGVAVDATISVYRQAA